MSVQLVWKNGAEVSMPPRYWSFFLCLAETCEWEPAGTIKPSGMAAHEQWNGNYETNDGQEVTDEDAREFSLGLNRCFYSDYCMDIMKSVAEQMEAQVEEEMGMKIPDAIRIDVSKLKDALGKIMTLSYNGGFRIQ